jgi:hypothetical protein
VSSAHRRLTKLESRCRESRAVAGIVLRIRHASDEEFYYMNKDGWLRRMAEQLSGAQLERLIAELKKMMATTKD